MRWNSGWGWIFGRLDEMPRLGRMHSRHRGGGDLPRWGLALVIGLLALVERVEGSRVYRPMGYYVREAEVILVANTHKGGERGYDTIVSVKEVLKGDGTLAGAEIIFPLARVFSTAEVPLRAPATNITMLLRKDWREQKPGSILEIYTRAEEMAAVRTLIKIYGTPGERQQLLALREVALAGNSLLLTQLVADLEEMREPGNFDIATKLWSEVAPTNQVKVLDLMAKTGDARAVPGLIKAMGSADENVSITAARHLLYSFPGAPGVTEAFEQALGQEHLKRIAARYLSKRRDDALLQEIDKPTPWLVAQGLLDSGKKEAGRAAFLKLVEDKEQNFFTRNRAAKILLTDATPAEKDHIRQALLKALMEQARGSNYIHLREAAEIMRSLNHADCLEALLAILPRTDNLDHEAARTATMAVRELGTAACQKSAAYLREHLNSVVFRPYQADPRTQYMLEVIWLADKETLEKFGSAVPEAWQATWKGVTPLKSFAEEKDPGAFLLRVLSEEKKLPAAAYEWGIFCLGEMKDRRAVPWLTGVVAEKSSRSSAMMGDYIINRAIREALVNIGGAEVESAMMELLTNAEERVRSPAIEILFQLKGAEARGLARRMLQEKDFGLVQPALMKLGQIGTPEDMELLLPYSDFWKADRKTQYWAMSAVRSIRERSNYDLNGPITKIRKNP